MTTETQETCEMWPKWPTSEGSCGALAVWRFKGECVPWIYACDACIGEGRAAAQRIAPNADPTITPNTP